MGTDKDGAGVAKHSDLTGRAAAAGGGAAGADPGSGPAGSDSEALGAGGLEPLGVVAGSERERLLAEAASATAAAPELSAQLEGAIDGKLRELTSWTQVTGEGVDIIALCFLPAWHLSDAERKRLSQRLARLLDLIVPPNFGEKTEAVICLALCAGGIVASRALVNGGKLPPIGPQQAPAPASARDPMGLSSLTE
ncbi:MAG: hypothetical protein ACRD1F_01785 [Terriglobales bacterium]